MLVVNMLKVKAAMFLFMKLVRGLKLKEAVKCLIIKRPRANSYLYLLSSKLKIKSR